MVFLASLAILSLASQDTVSPVVPLMEFLVTVFLVSLDSPVSPDMASLVGQITDTLGSLTDMEFAT